MLMDHKNMAVVFVLTENINFMTWPLETTNFWNAKISLKSSQQIHVFRYSYQNSYL
jgi:hypothetical protein